MRRFNAGQAFAWYLLITVVLAFPLFRRIATELPSDLGDPVLNTWILWWNSTIVPFTDRWWNPPIFHPSPDVLAYSEHLFGVSLFSTPIYWLTGNPVTAYNVAFLLTFPLSGLAAYLLCFELTRRRDAAWVAGLAFAFAPYRMDQLAHIQVLSSYWMPLGLVALHRFYRDGRNRWLIMFAIATLMQGLCNGYFLLFYPVLVVLWLLWFTPNEGWWRKVTAVGAAGFVGILPLLPLLLRYQRVHEGLGFGRQVAEVSLYSADVTGLLSGSTHLSAWGFLDAFHRGEGQLFPGMTLVILIVVALWRVDWRPTESDPTPLRIVRWLVVAVSILFAVGLAARFLFGPWEVQLFGWKVQIDQLPNAISQAMLFWICAFILSPAGTWAYRRHSPFAFYLLAAFALGVLSLGPRPTVLGLHFMGYAPYEWLMYLPGFDGLRVPARFWMLATICLGLLAGLAFSRLVPARDRRRPAVLALVTAGILIDGWVSFPTVPAPRRSLVLERLAEGPVLELPLGWRDDDTAAMLRATYHRQPIMNGHSGYTAPHYRALEYGLGWGKEEVLRELSALGVRHIRIDREHDQGQTYESFIATYSAARRVAETDTEALYELREVSSLKPPERYGAALDISRVQTNVNGMLASSAVDGDLISRWHGGSQDPGEEVLIELSHAQPVGAVVLKLGSYRVDFPRELVVEVSPDGVAWTKAWAGPTGAIAMLGALGSPREVPLVLPVGGRMARYIRLRQTAADPVFYWSIAELEVMGPS